MNRHPRFSLFNRGYYSTAEVCMRSGEKKISGSGPQLSQEHNPLVLLFLLLNRV
jgi:hypothetical protein